MITFNSHFKLIFNSHLTSIFVSPFMRSGFPKLLSPKAKACKILFGSIKPTNPSVLMVYKGQSSFGIITILYTDQACKTLFRPIKPTNPSIQMAYKGQSSFGKLVRSQWLCENPLSHETYMETAILDIT